MLAFDLADYYRTPVLVLADAIVAQTMEPVEMPNSSSFDKTLPQKNWALTKSV
jgi:2-oxoglutarate ferredoxin oxidoreductase subunit alpha